MQKSHVSVASNEWSHMNWSQLSAHPYKWIGAYKWCLMINFVRCVKKTFFNLCKICIELFRSTSVYFPLSAVFWEKISDEH